MSENINHPLLAYPEPERVAYLSIIAELCNVDGNFDDEEKKHLHDQIEAFEISNEGKAKIYAAVFHFKEEHRDEVLKTLHALDNSDLRFTLIADLFLIALCNGYISVEELEYVVMIGAQLGIGKDQVMAIKDVQFHLWQLKSIPSDSDAFKNMINTAVAAFPNFKVTATTLRAVKSATVNDWGAICWADGGFYEATNRQEMEIFDRVGGGDSFASGLIYGFISTRDPQQAVEYGAAHGALAMTTPGDTSMATKAEVERLMGGGGARVQR